MKSLTAAALAFLVVSTMSGVLGGFISKSLKKSFASEREEKDAIIEFRPIVTSVSSLSSILNLRGTNSQAKIIRHLKKATEASQKPVISALDSMGLGDSAQPFWIVNRIALKNLNLKTLSLLEAIPGDFTVREPFRVQAHPVTQPLDETNLVQNRSNPSTKVDSAWGVIKIRADQAHTAGFTGVGAIVAIIDTGVNMFHEALKDNHKPLFSWFDAVNDILSPYDDQGHGTHCAGISVGTKHDIGVAPGAQWIACKALDGAGSGTEEQLLKCAEFVGCPSGSEASCESPDVVNNSWGGVPGETFFNEAVLAWVLLGIVPVFSIGNTGPGCGTATSPGDQPNVLSVGATTIDDELAWFSSRGTGGTACQRALFRGIIKPEVVAPGVDILSASNAFNLNYVVKSGTSMAAPHVAGLAALIRSSNMALTVSEVIQRILGSTFPFDPLICFRTGDPKNPNNEFGTGRVDALKALNLA